MSARLSDEYLTVTEAATLLKVSRTTIRRMIDQGRLPAHRVGRQIRLRRDELQQTVALAGPAQSEDEIYTSIEEVKDLGPLT